MYLQKLSPHKRPLIIISIFLLSILLKVQQFHTSHPLNPICEYFTQGYNATHSIKIAQCSACVNLMNPEFKNVEKVVLQIKSKTTENKQIQNFTGTLLILQQSQYISYQCQQLNIVQDFFYTRPQSQELIQLLGLNRTISTTFDQSTSIPSINTTNLKSLVFRYRVLTNITGVSSTNLHFVSDSWQNRLIMVMAGLTIPNLEWYYFLSFVPYLGCLIRTIMISHVVKESELFGSAKQKIISLIYLATILIDQALNGGGEMLFLVILGIIIVLNRQQSITVFSIIAIGISSACFYAYNQKSDFLFLGVTTMFLLHKIYTDPENLKMQNLTEL